MLSISLVLHGVVGDDICAYRPVGGRLSGHGDEAHWIGQDTCRSNLPVGQLAREARRVPAVGQNLILRSHLIHHGINTLMPHGGHHCRRNLVGSLPRGIPTVVDESVEVHVIRTRW